MSYKPIHIDLEELLKNKVPKYYPYIPGALIRWLERTICQDELNRLLDNNAGKEGVEFADSILRDLDVKVKVIGAENLPADGSRRCVFVSNHPLGGLDGIALISLLGHHYGGKIKCVVNDMLMQVHPLAGVFLPANKHGRQSEADVLRINEAFASSDQMLYFPAGLCSRRQKGGVVADLDWKKSFVAKSVEYERDVVPIFFGGQNSDFFYKFARLRQRIGIKLNIEMVYLPSEMFKSRGCTFSVVVGKPIPWNTFTGGKKAAEYAADVKNIVYNLKENIRHICHGNYNRTSECPTDRS